MRIVVDGTAPVWAQDLARQIDSALAAVSAPLQYTVSNLPPARPAGAIVFVLDEAGGPVTAFADGEQWRRTTDREVCS
jgi:hypothetical protein